MSFKHAIGTTLKEIIQTALISLGIFFFVYIFLVQPHRVKGDSMVPNLKDGELLLTEKVNYRFGEPKRGDVVVFQAPGREVDFIKRIIALPGEKVDVVSGEIFVNNQKLGENYIDVQTQGDIDKTLGPDEYFMLGDNRGASFDSRMLGPVKKEALRGRAWLVYWPLFKNKAADGVRVISRVNYGVSNSFNNR